MRKILFIIFIILLLTFYMIAGEYSETINRSFEASDSSKLNIKNINGNINIKTYNGKKINIEAIKRSENKFELKSVKIIFEYDKDGLNIFPRGYKNNINACINYKIEIPNNLNEIYIKTVNGNIDGKGNFSKVKARTVNGTISFHAVMNVCSLSTVNGNIHVYRQSLFSGDMFMKSVNGSLKIELDSNSSFVVNGSTLNGHIKSDFPLKISKGFIGSSISGNIEGGKYKIRLKTVNGNIKLYKN